MNLKFYHFLFILVLTPLFYKKFWTHSAEVVQVKPTDVLGTQFLKVDKPSSIALTKKTAEPSLPMSKNLIDNWDFEGTGLSKEILAPYFKKRQPSSIVFFDNDQAKRIYPTRYESGSAQSDDILFISSEDTIKKTIREREDQASENSWRNGPMPDGLHALAENAFNILSFQPGKRENGQILKPLAGNFSQALQGPDYSFDMYDINNEAQRLQHFSTILPLGNSGGLILKVSGDGFLQDDSGFDFTIFHTAFRLSGTNLYFQKFGYVGVSDDLSPANIKWFECHPLQGFLRGCAGAVPTNEGGDQFDLATIGVKQARYIWIKDIGNNKNFPPSPWPTEGLVLDAVRLNHAYTK